MMQPVIAVTVSRRSAWRIFPLVACNLRLAGARAVRWLDESEARIDTVDGVVIGGGDDISPDLYGGHLVTSARLDPQRDAMERHIVEAAFRAGKPVLGICRGSQMLNVALGGTLHQDAYEVYRESRRHWTVLPRKEVRVERHTRLAAIAGAEPMRVNALHSQSTDALGQGLRVAAYDPGGMIQAIERVREPFALGVQWHPEHLFYARRQRRLFSALVAAAAAGHDHEPQLLRVDETM